MAIDYSEYAVLGTKNNDGLSIDENGNLYASNSGRFSSNTLTGESVYKIAPNGAVSTFTTDLSGPLGSYFDSAGNFYVANYNNGKITKISVNGEKAVFSNFSNASAITINSQGEFFVSSFFGNKIYKVDSTGNKEVWVTDSRFDGPVGISLDEEENIYVANYNGGKVFKIDSNKSISQLANLPSGIGYITYSNGILYATGYTTNRIYKIPINGDQYTTLEGSVDAGFSAPNGIIVSHDGSKLFVSNYENKTIMLIENFTDNSPALPQANDDSVTVDQDSFVEINMLENDDAYQSELDPASINITEFSQNGDVTIDDSTGMATYSPTQGFSGTDNFSYTVSNSLGEVSNEAMVSITINDTMAEPLAQNDSATVEQDKEVVINILANDAPSGGTLDISSVDIINFAQNGSTTVSTSTGSIAYTPNASYIGSDSFTYIVNNTNGNSSNEATVSVTITEAVIDEPPKEKQSSGGGSIGIFSILFLALRARFANK
jgi:sugar lactone lactonase YvrE